MALPLANNSWWLIVAHFLDIGSDNVEDEFSNGNLFEPGEAIEAHVMCITTDQGEYLL